MPGTRDSYVVKEELKGKNCKNKSKKMNSKVEIHAIRNHRRRITKAQSRVTKKQSVPQNSMIKKSS
eukprot:CAMPEP_0194216224 /NCGR_PEP_ID=MMETSP0156-20130528/18577_1 /TAXON_ID=33649 /ORGANISM="Thalassionema nitzschioides, Strain L26-B" /LENGTH=65 /DNA_ID=CAMNT_0038944941 /DNA_START=399 /DNA_END=592 /DNA_ORIENTATION=+